MKQIKKYKTYVYVFFIMLLIGILVITKVWQCPLDYIFGTPCPLCGITRSFLCLFHFDFKGAFYYHALWPIVLVSLPTYFYIRFKGIKVSKKLENTICILIGIIFLTYFIIRHITGSEIVQIHFYDSLIYKIYLLLFK